MASFVPVPTPSQAQRQALQQEVNIFVSSTGISSDDIRDALEYLRDRPRVEPIRNFTQERQARFQQLSDFRDEVRSQKNDEGWNFTALQLHFLLNCAVVSSATIQEVLQDKLKGTSDRIDWLDHIVDIVTLTISTVRQKDDVRQLTPTPRSKRKSPPTTPNLPILGERFCGHQRSVSLPENSIKMAISSMPSSPAINSGISTPTSIGSNRSKIAVREVNLRDGEQCCVLKTSLSQVAHIFPFANNAKQECLNRLGSSQAAFLLHHGERRNRFQLLLTSKTKCLDRTANMLCLDYTLHTLLDKGFIALWWVGAYPANCNANAWPLKDGEITARVPISADASADLRHFFMADCPWTVQIQLQFQHRQRQDANRYVELDSPNDEIFDAFHAMHPNTASHKEFATFSACRTKTGRRLQDGQIFTMHVRYADLEDMKMLIAWHWLCTTTHTLAGGAGLVPEEYDSDESSECSPLQYYEDSCSDIESELDLNMENPSGIDKTVMPDAS